MKFLVSHTKRALSTVVTSAILLTAVAVMGTMVVGWSNSNLTVHKQELESSFSDHINRLNEDLLLEHVWFGGTGPSVNITMNNVGTVGLNVTEIKIKNPSTGETIDSFAYTNGGIVTSGTLSVNETFAWVSSTPYDVVITTERGSLFKTQVTAP